MNLSALQFETEFKRILTDLFRQAGWTVRQSVPEGEDLSGLLVVGDGQPYLVGVKRLSEGRRDRLIPLLAQTILQTKRAATEHSPNTLPIAVVASNRIPVSVAEAAKRFAERHAPEVGAGVIDTQGLRLFAGHGLGRFDARPTRRVSAAIPSRPALPRLFSDLNQWMLKILIYQALPESLARVPRQEFRSATELARAADVSIMSAARFVRRLHEEGFLHERRDQLKLVRISELLERWVAANRQAFREVPARWILSQGEAQLREVLAKNLGAGSSSVGRFRSREGANVRFESRCCLGLFAAADALGVGFVRGVPTHLYVEDLEPDALRSFGLMADYATSAPDVYVRAPTNQQAVFRAATTVAGVPVCDMLQVWLDVATHPARGQEQAEVIRRHALRPLLA